jgi:hypothetical protein
LLKKYIRRLSYISIFLLILAGCGKDNDTSCFMSWGKESVTEKNIDAFDTLIINDLFQVYFHKSDEYKVEISGGENVIKGINCTVENNTLTVENENVCNWVRTYNKDITINIYSPIINKIIMIGESDLFSVDTFETDTFFLLVYSDIGTADIKLNTKHSILKVNAGTGRYTFRGSTKSSYVYSHGSSFIYEDKLQTENSQLVNISCGDIFVNVTNLLFVEYIGRGDIFYKGDPDEIVVKESTGEGELIKLN